MEVLALGFKIVEAPNWWTAQTQPYRHMVLCLVGMTLTTTKSGEQIFKRNGKVYACFPYVWAKQHSSFKYSATDLVSTRMGVFDYQEIKAICLQIARDNDMFYVRDARNGTPLHTILKEVIQII